MNNQPVYVMRTPISSSLPKIVVAGLGGGGCNAINRMIENGMQGVTFVACNTDAQALAHNLSPNKIQLGPKSTRGLGAGGLPVVGETAAEESYRELASI
ncbi:MAG: cell division protein FtsZ, partial [Chloroflexi bacterium]|nr:cell division protein FtsZ [Chloroflexota bacterium]